jgi:hypothetical protein
VEDKKIAGPAAAKVCAASKLTCVFNVQEIKVNALISDQA